MRFINLLLLTIILHTNSMAEVQNIFNLQNNKNDALVQIKEAFKEYQQYLKNRDIFSIEKAYNKAQKAYQLQPSSLQIDSLFFQIAYSKLMLTKDKTIIPKLKTLFPILYNANQNIASPSYIEAYFTPKSNNNKRLKLFKKALKENSKYPSTYLYLSDEYIAKDRYNLALDILKRGQKTGLLETEFHYSLAYTYMYKSIYLEDKNGCAADNKKLTKQIIKEAKAVLEKNPDITDMYRLLTSAYKRLGQKRLALYNAKTLYKKLDNNESLNSYALCLIAYNKGINILKDSKDKIDKYTLIEYYFYQQKWEKVITNLEKYIKDNNSTYIYDYILLASSKGKYINKKAMYQIMNNLPSHVKTDNWKNHLIEYFTDKISEDIFLSFADTKCKKTEAYFYIGFRYFIDNNNQKAKEYFQQVLDQKLYSYKEYVASEYFLRDGLK